MHSAKHGKAALQSHNMQKVELRDQARHVAHPINEGTDDRLQCLCPVACSFDVEADEVVIRRGCYAERMPLHHRYLGNINVAVLSRPAHMQ